MHAGIANYCMYLCNSGLLHLAVLQFGCIIGQLILNTMPLHSYVYYICRKFLTVFKEFCMGGSKGKSVLYFS